MDLYLGAGGRDFVFGRGIFACERGAYSQIFEVHVERKWLMNENLGEFYDVSSCKEDPEIDC